MNFDFNDKVALITGSSSGIGAAIAVQFAQCGAKITITGRDARALSTIAEAIEKASPRKHQPLQIVGDLVADEQLPARLINETIQKYGRLDILVNNAGATSPNDSLFNQNILQNFDKVYQLNVRSVLQLTTLAVPHLEKTKGNIINISSIAGIRAWSVVYSSSKAALDMITKASAQELGPKGIRVNAISPGPVATQFLRSYGLNMETMKDYIEEKMKESTLLKILPQSSDIANLATFLASDYARNMTGSIVVSDSGIGKVALVTGSSSGIGAAIALQFAQYGAKVCITGRDSNALEKVAGEIEKATGGKHRPLKIIGDLVEDRQLPVRLINETVNEFGRLDFLVNNAGGSTAHGKLTDENLMDSYDKVFDLNVRSVLHLCQVAKPHLEKTKGNIINISSIAAIVPVRIEYFSNRLNSLMFSAKYSLIYSPSKAALDMMTKCLAIEYGDIGVRVNSINPGPVRTGFLRSMGMQMDNYDELYDRYSSNTLLNFVPYGDEIANLASFLASDDAKNLTGSIVVSDTGCMLMKPKIEMRQSDNK
ncbi:dehydrogenase/reductase SDR family member 2-like protein [Sarcoptes scabiei]|uniref:Dehydrogenase/reductase SDR family member 2-like protein n=1 Tax=Sarcoptes scabiei TaxID=52283 RepID=A0A132ALD6_SARSC|nr:dehydrogenase/reductase SDR family member 2-like protein [Sarcoptes scabiei]